ncbi:large ribosomal subunit protein uL24m-like [Saccoglossus kowalevskii]|uniref:Probable 39S ribosomal protein L24, mitochondrial-like n=1 Tax=Saccoglossus kowalevskii TaxID=10224 RepID=A0ABM0GMI9_SACKO|nr:PREDICTED: probable 39S ribosomal protein L24, mitochondrial-like [Saccoglossus kowalevskii]
MRLTRLLFTSRRYPLDDPWAKDWWKKINKNFRYGMAKPKTPASLKANYPGRNRPAVLVEPLKDWNYFRGDLVQILIGKDQGKHGTICEIIRERNWVVVEGLNCHYKCLGKTEGYRGMYIKSEAPLLHNQVALIDPSDNKPTSIKWKYNESGEKVRVSIRTGRIIPLSPMAFQHPDYKTKDSYSEQTKDTVGEHASKDSYKPSLKLVEEELMDAMGIIETRKPGKTWWY